MIYAQALQQVGRHSDALIALDEAASIEQGLNSAQDPRAEVFWKLHRARSLSALGHHPIARKLVKECLEMLPSLSKREQGLISLDLGKILFHASEPEEAGDCWRTGLDALEGEEQEIEHYARLLSNLASTKLRSAETTLQEEGMAMMSKSMDLKISLGDLAGLANCYDMLAFYYKRINRFQPAIANFRKGLALSRQIADRHGEVQALLNLSALYHELFQVGAARSLNREAQILSEKLNNEHFAEICQFNREQIDGQARELGMCGEKKIGPKALCMCGSGKTYEECCGRADFDPVALPWSFGGHSQDAQKVANQLKDAGIAPSRLDLFLSNPDKDKERLAWFKVVPQDGWHEVHELPDLASIHLRASEDACARAQEMPKSFEYPLSALIMAACALEAFVNQVAFFVVEINRTDGLDTSRLPPELLDDCFLYQRSTELTEKWDSLGGALCHKHWPFNAALWSDFKRLVTLRNEFVHFKLSDYEQIVPPPKRPSKALNMLPADVAPSEGNHSWAFKILSPAMALWAVTTAQSMISEFRSAYAQTRTSEKI